jgi:hypothetical protein
MKSVLADNTDPVVFSNINLYCLQFRKIFGLKDVLYKEKRCAVITALILVGLGT